MTELTVAAKSSDWEILEHDQNLPGVQSHSPQPFFCLMSKVSSPSNHYNYFHLQFHHLSPLLYAFEECFINSSAVFSSHLLCFFIL